MPLPSTVTHIRATYTVALAQQDTRVRSVLFSDDGWTV